MKNLGSEWTTAMIFSHSWVAAGGGTGGPAFQGPLHALASAGMQELHTELREAQSHPGKHGCGLSMENWRPEVMESVSGRKMVVEGKGSAEEESGHYCRNCPVETLKNLTGSRVNGQKVVRAAITN